MLRKLRVVVPAAAVTVVLSGLSVVTTSAPVQAAPYSPSPGVVFNNPLGAKTARQRINRHVIGAINHAPAGSRIRIASWNLRSDWFVDRLVAAHKRGVGVRVVIDRGNANPNNVNKGFNFLQQRLSRGNATRPARLQSFARTCRQSCRAPRGISHTKMYLFERTGAAQWVTMYGSSNATDLAAGFQWNELYTMVNRPVLWRSLAGVFNEMAKDRRVGQPYREYSAGPDRNLYVYPYRGKNLPAADPVLAELRQIECTGANRGTGINGRTSIRIAMTAWNGDRGIKLANRVRTLYNQGCDIRIVYGVMGNRVLDILRATSGRGRVPLQQIAQDWNKDGLYDRYLHMKAMAVSGVYRGTRSAEVTWNGSANWTGVAMASDEVSGRIFGANPRRRYADWINYLFENPPPGAPPRWGRATTDASVPVVENPYALMELD